ncbi:MAG: GPW/gp25 family protein [Caldilineaceae bacterium]
MNNTRKEYVGQGLSFPLSLTPKGEIALVTGTTDVDQAMQVILETMPGERVMRPNFGCRIWELLFAPNDAETRALAAYHVRQALEFWEPRVTIDSIDVATDHDASALRITITYTIKDTHDTRSIIYPFFLMGEE